MDTIKMEEDPDGLSQQVAVIMTGQVYRDAGLKYSKHPVVEGQLYDKLCEIGKHKLRDDVRKMALAIALSVSDKEFKPTVAWLDNFMRRFCLSKKKMGFHSSAMLKQKISAKSEETPPPLFRINKLTQEEVLNALGINVEGGNDVSEENNDTTSLVENGKSKGEVSSGQNGSQVELNGESPPEVDPFKDIERKVNIKIEPEDSLSKETSEGKVIKETNIEDSLSKETSEGKVIKETNIEDSLSKETSDGKVIKETNMSNVKIKEEPKNSIDMVSESNINLSTCEKETVGDKNIKNKACLNSSIENGMEVGENLEKEKSADTNSVNEKENDLQLQNKEANEKLNAETQLIAPEKQGNDKATDKNLNDSSRNEKTRVEDPGNADKEKEPDSSNDANSENEENTSNSNESDEDGSQSSDDNEAGSEASDDDDDTDREAKQKSKVDNNVQKTRQEEDEIINYSKEENKYYHKNHDELVKRLNGSVIRCTSCNEQVNHQLRSLVHTHPELKVFICKRCRKYYGKGKYCKDDEGYDEYCRLCAEGGDLLCCEQENCFNGFCKRCVKRTMGRSELKKAETTENWACYVCDPSPMMELRAIHRTILSNLKNSDEQDANLSRNELRTKNIKKKFDVLKKRRIERSLLESPEKKEGKVGSKNAKRTSAKKSKDEVPEDGIQSMLRETIDNMSEMLSLCIKNVKTIDSKWKENRYSQEATEKAGKRIMKQLHAVRNNFEIMENELESNLKQFTESLSSGSKETENPDVQAEDSNAQSTSGKDSKSCQESDEKIGNSKLCKDKKEIHKTKNQKKSADSEDSDNADTGNVEDKSKAGDKADNGRRSSARHAKSNKVEDSPMEVDDCQDSSKAALSSDDDHSLPDLQNTIDGILTDGSNDINGAQEHEMSGGENEDAFDRLGKDSTRRSTRSTRSTKESDNMKDKQPETRQKRKKDQKKKECDKDEDDLKEDTKSSAEEYNESGGDSKKSRTSRRLRKLKAESNEEDNIYSEAELKKNSSKKSMKEMTSKIDNSESVIDDDNDDREKLNKRSASPSVTKDSEESEEDKSGKVDEDIKMKDKADEKDSKKKIKVQKQEEVEEEDDKNVKKLKEDDDSDNCKGDMKELKEDNGNSKRVKKEPSEVDDEGNQNVTKAAKLELSEDDEKMEEKQGSDDEEEEDRGKKNKRKENTKEKEDKHSKKKRRQEEKGENKKGNKQNEDERVLRKRNKPKEEEEGEDKKTQRQRRNKRSCRENKDEDSQECRKSTRRRSRKNNDEDEDEDVLLGLVEESSGSSDEEDTDEEMRRREADREPVRKKKRKTNKSRKESKGDKENEEGDEKEDEEDEKEDEEEEKEEEEEAKEEAEGKDVVKTKNKKKSSESSKDDDEQIESDKNNGKSSEGQKEGSKEKHKKASKNEKKKEIRENEKALSTLLASDSGGEGETIEGAQAKKESDEPCKKIVSETSSNNSEESTAENKKKKMKKKSKDGKSHSKNDNQKAKAALLESESEDDLEDKPKPRCKKKNYKKSLKNDKIAKKQFRTLRKTLTEEERDELKEKQLKDKCQVDLMELSSSIKEKIKEEDFVYVTDFPELYLNNRHILDSDDCDADEEESDKEFTKLMSFKMTKYSKPAPKCKKKFVKSESEQEEEGEEDRKEEKDENEDKDGKENGSSKKIKKEGAVKKKKEGLLDINIDKEDEEEEEEEDDDDDDKKKKKKKKEGGISLNEKIKKQILMSSDEEDEDDDEQEETLKDDPEEEEKERKKYDEKKRKKEEEKQQQGSAEESGEEYVPKVYKKGYMNLNISSEEEEGAEDEEAEIESDDENDSDFEESPRKKRAFQISSSESEDDKRRKRKKASSSDYNSDDDDDSDKPKAKRKRIKKMTSSSDEEEDDDDDDGEKNKDESPNKHKKIRRVIRDEDLLETTKNATQEEEERRKRIKERQKQYNQIFEIDVESDQKELGKLVLDFDPETKAELVSVHEKLVKFLKPHQFKGIKFMWDATIESLEMLKENSGSGCILAHCMGLGKTLQVIAFVHTLLINKKTNRHVQRVMVCCPVNTVYNWVSEFSNWLKGKMLPFDVVELASAKDLWGRAYRLDDWWREGGVCIIGYDMFRNLANSKCKRFKGKMKEIFQKTLLNPGPDLMVCDEGHILKNEATALSKTITQIKTRRRIVLTGTPLQNNLKEYHCMIQFVKPNLLGTKKEFMNRFVNPIEQGQCVDAMPRDVRRMKRRAHILHNLLEGCVQRFDYTVLKPFLPPKFEYVISVQLSEIQCKLYQYYLDNLAQGGPKRQGSGLFVDFNCLSRVWTHPKVLELAVRRALFNDDEEELDDFICDDTTTSDSSDDERSRKKKKKIEKKKNDESEEEELKVEEVEKPGPIPGLTESGKVRVDWWKKVIDDNITKDEDEADFLDKLEHSGKIILLLDILRECSSIGDKVLLFSQSLLALDMIEEFLQLIDEGVLELPQPDDPLPLPFKQWKKERDYLRLDGSSAADSRKNMCKLFNSPTNERCRLFLISTRAGGLGINLVAANRVIIFDSSWNPSHDTQSIFRLYRFGQKKPCYVYRFVAQGTMEEKIYSRQVTKMSTALRVVDEHQIKRYFKMDELAQLYEFTPADTDKRDIPIVPEDRLLAEMLKRHKSWIVDYHEHDSLLENQTSEELTEEERTAAWEDYENEKKGFMVQQQRNSVMSVVGNPTVMTNATNLPSLSLSSFSFEGVVNTIKAQNPNLTQQEMCESVVLATKQIQKIHLNHYQRVQGMVYNLKNPMIAPEQRKLLPFGNHPEMLPMLEQQLRMLEENIQRENQVINHMSQITPQREQVSMASLMSAGLIRGQPPSAGVSSATTNYVARPSKTPSSTFKPIMLPPQPKPPEKKPGSNDVIMLD